MHTPGQDDLHGPNRPNDPWQTPGQTPPHPPAYPPAQPTEQTTYGYAQPPRQPVYYQPPRPPKPPRPPREPLSPIGRGRVILAWVWVGVFTLLAIIVQIEQAKLTPADPIVTARPDTQVTIQGKYTLFVDSMGGSNQTGYGGMSALDQAVVDLENTTFSSHDLVRIVIIRGEVYGSDDALYMIDEIRTPGMFNYVPTGEDLTDLELLEKVYTGQALTTPEEDRLEERHLWFGELATTYQSTPATSAYTHPRKAGSRLVIGLVVIGLLLFFMAIAGIVCLILGIVMLVNGSITWHFKAQARPREAPALIESLAIFLALFVISGALFVAFFQSNEPMSNYINVVSLFLIALCGLLPLLFGIGWSRFREIVGLHRGQGLFKEIGCGALGYLAGTPLIVVGFIISFILFTISIAIWPPDPDLPAFDPMSGIGGWSLVAMILLLVVWAPVVEEIIFRGFFYAHCRRWMHWSLSSIVVGIVFAAIHPQGIWFIPGLAATGFVLAGIREWRGSLIGSMTGHAIHNGTVAIVLLTVTLA